ncbi:hypothetical protein P171DRAFT_491883 [Karstenula rhodostoma CBS 690.94]|uniref:Amidohydrolase-related domain-containing protein n=1 Tax=Karstenula rhodostoma CBS 690.94 TaxID=1392251 RepID=A0A9P4U5X9_9PLEO|nr:hypothetical protein P171DRAFT_491883 [Karstenula rhodostoma CBS 690.94]
MAFREAWNSATEVYNQILLWPSTVPPAWKMKACVLPMTPSHIVGQTNRKGQAYVFSSLQYGAVYVAHQCSHIHLCQSLGKAYRFIHRQHRTITFDSDFRPSEDEVLETLNSTVDDMFDISPFMLGDVNSEGQLNMTNERRALGAFFLLRSVYVALSVDPLSHPQLQKLFISWGASGPNLVSRQHRTYGTSALPSILNGRDRASKRFKREDYLLGCGSHPDHAASLNIPSLITTNNLARPNSTIPHRKIALHNVQVFDGTCVLSPSTVVIDGPFIGSDPTDAEHIDRKGGVLLPGLIDAHCHPTNLTHMQELARWGVTSGFVMACFSQELSSAPGSVDGNIVVAATRDASALANGTAAVPGWIDPTLDSLVTEAHLHSKQTVTHAAKRDAYTHAILSRTDHVHHAPLDTGLSPALAHTMQQQGQTSTPTLTMMRATALTGTTASGTNFTAALATTSLLHRSRVPVLAGTDANLQSGVPAMVPFGTSLHDELENHVEAGISPVDALLAATVKRVPLDFYICPSASTCTWHPPSNLSTPAATAPCTPLASPPTIIGPDPGGVCLLYSSPDCAPDSLLDISSNATGAGQAKGAVVCPGISAEFVPVGMRGFSCFAVGVGYGGREEGGENEKDGEGEKKDGEGGENDEDGEVEVVGVPIMRPGVGHRGARR